MLNEKELMIQKAINAAKNSYSPYSKFKVGAALLTDDNSVYTGTNVENASYGLTMCAERTAIFKAVSEGHRKFKTLVIYCDVPEADDHAMPCGACRQVMAEFFDEKTKIIVTNGKDSIVLTLKDLLPHSFVL